MPPLDLYLELRQQLIGLLVEEQNIRMMRGRHSRDQQFQLEMDRLQSDIDIRRAEIDHTMMFVSNSN